MVVIMLMMMMMMMMMIIIIIIIIIIIMRNLRVIISISVTEWLASLCCVAGSILSSLMDGKYGIFVDFFSHT